MEQEFGQLGNEAVAGRIVTGFNQFSVVFQQVGRVVQFHLWDGFAIRTEGLCIDVGSHVENHGVVGTVQVMLVAFPVGGMHMDFYIAYPKDTVYLDFCVEKVRTGIGIGESGVNDFHGLPLGGA